MSRSAKIAPLCAMLLLTVTAIPEAPASSVLWTAPAILAASMLIAWAAESAQFFIAQKQRVGGKFGFNHGATTIEGPRRLLADWARL